MSSPPCFTSQLLSAVPFVRHGFFGRQGGVSSGIFESLNCSYYSGDLEQAVNTNRQRVLDCLGGASVFSNKQIHSNRIRAIEKNTDSDQVYSGDGMVTRAPGLCLAAMGADCAPVLFADRTARIVGAAHAGWKGALLGVTDTVIEKMIELGAQPGRIVCAVGPAMQVESYQVGREFVDRFRTDSPVECADCFRKDVSDGTDYFDLPRYLRKRIERAGVSSVEVLANDTYQEETRFFSYRRSCHRGEADYGRQVGVIMLT